MDQKIMMSVGITRLRLQVGMHAVTVVNPLQHCALANDVSMICYDVVVGHFPNGDNIGG